jgi:hypothetical protein
MMRTKRCAVFLYFGLTYDVKGTRRKGDRAVDFDTANQFHELLTAEKNK